MSRIPTSSGSPSTHSPVKASAPGLRSICSDLIRSRLPPQATRHESRSDSRSGQGGDHPVHDGPPDLRQPRQPHRREFGSALDEEGKGAAAVAASVRDANKRTALHFAAREGQTKLCKFLIEQLRLPVDPKDDDGETPLIHTARQGRQETVEYLLGRGVDPSVASNMGATALHHAASIVERISERTCGVYFSCYYMTH
ncbi:ankyrin repeat domain-containing protein 27-like isoform X2 [Triticum dicoccoides]|uniref:ankyrin repeat domain-containing protein 27-like isoform X2 n=1 Tax=Triticum dicoccoides TaxID=85692 RepID=UPI00188F9D12|nr:ankyrin repeat domain-containing protein 27-like isoform X2 [Triticum dicoccoides]